MDKFKFPDELEEENSVQIESNADEIEIEVVDDTPVADRGRKALDKEVEDPTDEEIASYGDKVKVRIKELTHARHDERRAKEALMREKLELENMARQVVAENQQLRKHVSDGSQQFQQQSAQLAENELENARKQYKVAQEALFEAKIKVQNAQNFRPPPLQNENYEVQPRQQAPEPVRADEKTLRWQAKNQWFGTDGFEEVTSFALGLHQKLVNNGVDPRSDDYFEQIDARVKSTFPEVFGGNEERPKSNETPRRPSSVVAPASRSTGTRKIQLTPTQAALIKKYNLDPKKYVAEVLKLENQND